MSNVSRLTLAFIDRRPTEAARILAAKPAPEAADFIGNIPTRHAVKVLTPLNPRLTALIIRQLDNDAAVAILREMEFAAATVVLRQLTPAERRTLLAELPRRRQIQFETSLAFPPNTVGARMTTNINALPTTATCATAVALLKSDSGEQSDLLFLHDAKRQYKGTLRLLDLLKHPDNTQLLNLIDSALVSLSPHANLQAVAMLEAWNDYQQLPVLSRRGEIIGALHRRTLAVHSTQSISPVAQGTDSLFHALCGAMTHTVRGLATSLTSFSSDSQTSRRSS